MKFPFRSTPCLTICNWCCLSVVVLPRALVTSMDQTPDIFFLLLCCSCPADNYVWLGEDVHFPAMNADDESSHESTHVLSLGMGAVPNCHFGLLNVEMVLEHDLVDDEDGASSTTSNDTPPPTRTMTTTGPGMGAYSPWQGRQAYATTTIAPGQELFLSYGEE
jgi:hypothetical protein